MPILFLELTYLCIFSRIGISLNISPKFLFKYYNNASIMVYCHTIIHFIKLL